MAQIDAVAVQPSLLLWARETAGLSVEEAAHKLGVAIDKLLAYETGKTPPSLPQLRSMAGVYKRSLGIFFLPTPPETPKEITDFRGLKSQSENTYSSDLRYQIRHARYRRKLALELLSDLGEESPIFTVRASLDESPEIVGRRIRDWLGISIEQQKTWKEEYDSLNSWLLILESKSILVFQTKHISEEEMIGACIYFNILPIILLNGKFSPNSKIFTLMHELAHLALGESGVSSLDSVDASRKENQYYRIEQFCNHVAAEILVPTPAIKQLLIEKGYKEIDEAALSSIANFFSVSCEVVLRKLSHVNSISHNDFQRQMTKLRADYKRAKSRNKGSAPIQHHIIVARNNGVLFTRLVCEAFESSRIGAGEFSSYLDVNIKHADKIIEVVNKKRSLQ